MNGEIKSVEQILEKKGVIREGHFLLKSKKHSGKYIDLKLLSLYPDGMSEVCDVVAGKIKEVFFDQEIDTIIGPAVGAIIPSYEIAKKLEVQNNFVEKVEGGLVCRNPQNIIGKYVIIVEDVATTGGTIQQTINYVTEIGGTVIGVAVLVDRSGGDADFGVPMVSGAELSFSVYEAEECPLCREGIELIKPGSKN